ncbi:MAG TPA: hypothetical protein VF132_05425 [Rudaea sp.]
MNRTTRNRLVLVAIAIVFFGPLLAAFVLNRSGWRPEKTRNYGTLIEPVRSVSSVSVKLADGSALTWSDPQWHWTLLALPGADCGSNCQSALGAVMRMRLTLGRNAERLRVIYLGPPLPADAAAALAPLQSGTDVSDRFAEYRPKGSDAVSLALVDPNGNLLLRHDAGFDVARVRDDLVKVVH